MQNNGIKEQALKYNSTQKPNIKHYVKYKVADSYDIPDAQIIGSAGKASGKNKNWYNTKNLAKNTFFKFNHLGQSKFLKTFPYRWDILINL